MAILGTAIEQGWSYVKDKDVSLGLLVVCGIILAFTWLYANEVFIPRAEAEENVKTLQQAVEQLAEKQDTHIKDWRIRTAVESVERIETEMWHLKEHEMLAGESMATEDRERYLKAKLGHAKEYKDCVINNRPNCEHLRDNR